jgi:hypothetical protein
MSALPTNIGGNFTIASRGRMFRTLDLPIVRHAAAEFGGGFEEGTQVTMYRKGLADPETSIFRDVERTGVVRGQAEAVVPMIDAAAELGGLGIDTRTLIKIDIEVAEYQVIPALATLLAARKPFVHVSFHPFNIVVSDDPYVNAVARLRSALVVAEALASYRFMHVFTRDGWVCIDPPSRLHFLRHYLLAQKQVPRSPTPYYGFTDAVGFSDDKLPGLND